MWDAHDGEGKLKEIITKAVCARGWKTFVKEYELAPVCTPEKILGCWVANHQFTAKAFPNYIVIKGELDVTVWYAFDDNTKTDLLRETVTYCEEIPLQDTEGRLEKDEEIRIDERVEPVCLGARICDGELLVEVEAGFFVEIIGETKMCVLAYPPGCCDEDFLDDKDCEEVYVDIEDEDSMEV